MTHARTTSSHLKIILSLAIIIVSFLGIMDASYITFSKLSGSVPPCQPPFACTAVLESPWSSIGPIPLSLLGLVYYATVFIVGIMNYVEIKVIHLPKKVRFHIEDVLLFLTSFGALFSGYLVFIMAVVLQAWCLYCIFSATFCVSLFLLSLFLRQVVLREKKHIYSFRRNMFRSLYHYVFKPIFFMFDAEFVHNVMTTTGNILGSSSITRTLTRSLFSFSDPTLRKELNNIVFPNPVGLAAGFDYNGQLPEILPSVGFGFATIGTVTYEPYEGNVKPRLGRFPRSKALLVNKGFKSIGAKEIIKKLEYRNFQIPIGISIGSTNKLHTSLKHQIDDIVKTFRLFQCSAVQHRYYELNISCPNTKGGQPFTTPQRLEELLIHIDGLEVRRPIFVKMPIDLSKSETTALLDVISEHHIAGVIFGNLTKDRTNPDVHSKDRQTWKTRQGNLSGKPTWNRSNALIQLTKKRYKSRFTIIGTGGIFTPEDALYKLKIGADVIQLISGMIFEGPQLVGEINEKLSRQKK